MITKLDAARIANASGCHTLITLGEPDHPLALYEQKGRGTWFIADSATANPWKQWIGGTLNHAGSITINTGAGDALTDFEVMAALKRLVDDAYLVQS